MDPDSFAQIQSQVESSFKPVATAPKRPKGPGGIAGFLTNALPSIGGGLGAVAGIPLDIFGGAGSIAGGAVGAGLGETLKRKILGEKLDAKQIGIQALEGGASAAINPFKLLKGASAATKSFVKGGAQTAGNLTEGTTEKTGGQFLKNLTTQGQQAQGRVAGISAGSKVAGKELAPQDTERMLNTLREEGIKTGNANNTFRDLTEKLQTYGKQIDDHFKANDAPLHTDDTQQIANNFLSGLKTTDPGVLKEAQILADDLQKNVKSTRDLWKFRRTLDGRIPDSKFMDAATSNKVTALKQMRQYISDELGNVPGMKNYHDLSEIKPFISAEAKRLNNPGGGVFGRLLASGPVQKTENAIGKGTETLAQRLSKGEPPPPIERGVVDETQPLKVASAGAPPPPPGDIPDEVLQSASAATKTLPETPTPVGTGFLGQVLKGAKSVATLPARMVAAPLAFPGQSAGAVLKQEAARGFGLPAAVAQGQQNANDQSGTAINAADALIKSNAGNQQASTDPFDPSNVQANAQAILQQGGTLKDVGDYLATVKAYQALTTPSGQNLNASQQQQANNAISGLQDIQSLSEMLSKDPSLTLKSALPGGSITQRLAGTTDYEAAKNNIVDVISRLRSGAAISASEEKLYKSLLPAAGDSAESANSKLSRLANLLNSFANPQGGGGSDVTDLLANAGVQ